MQPATLVDILGPHSYEPVLAVAHIRTKLHDHVRELVQVRACTKVLHGFVLELADLLW